MEQDKLGHNFLARLGKAHLRPGGRVANDWLIANGDFNKEKKVLNIACNSGDTAIALATKFGCNVTGIDLDEEALEKARHTVTENKKVSDLVEFVQGDIIQLPFSDNQFDIIVNEVMLTLLPLEMKQQALTEYLRVLKPNGLLLTHDIMLETKDEAEDVIAELEDVMNATIAPLTKSEWKENFKQCGFRNVDTFSGEISLFSPKGLIDYQGFAGVLKIIGRALKTKNHKSFIKMLKAFRDAENKLEFIAICSQK
ncbi:class I SAM-dependent methyltransferase [Phocoenobacter skyensis]|nr:class I SAM-dependent methyltransferase [Pasteurella skyensis]MDP8079762.1 class I SAM-dependent methyltransferase [Pasteurella skyensis]MDP8085663.1 class I SAM-dependent methyltransferase [Pasteurella skyensis]MDP8170064.1 class I SAM-dependent methyltransferase [Pasteurella skyensis]MDP8175664.1 class I SAM-dependent methyltransferase [Pasteurella skyensis]MDP8185433.1 class I SAM-dependent methyltransferase [Pasteurella skyensis]